ncbi:MAG: serine/threonine protein kinase [bacterium]|nr:serine/threonine protein kinase [bacterium]
MDDATRRGSAGFDEVFLLALNLPVSDRAAYPDQACADDAAMRSEIMEMLAIADLRRTCLVPPEIGLVPDRIGRYEILCECGRGGMGIVLRAKDTQLLREVALKILPQFLSRVPRNLERFTREAQILAGLSHPGIATLFSMEKCDGFHFLTMEFVEGTTLSEILAERPLTFAETLPIGIQICRALEAAHGKRVCHCDLKPANIMVAHGGEVSVLDFGIARAFDQLMRPMAFESTEPPGASRSAGTPAYMAPEQITGQALDERTDLWALGAVLFECLTGECLPDATRTGDAGWTKRLPRRLPPKFVELLKSCLAPDRDQRICSASAVGDALEQLRRTKSHRIRLWRAALGAAIATAALVAYLATGRPTSPLARLEISGDHVLTAVDARGETAWTRHFAAPIRATLLLERSGRKHENGKDPGGCVVTTMFSSGRSELEYLDVRDGQPIWSHQPAWTMPVNASGPIQYRWTTSADWPGWRHR